MSSLSYGGPASAALRARRWSHGLAWCLCAATGVLLAAGALVTGTGSSLAVPDWPLAYGSLFPPMVGGILYEHGHRLIAATVGLLSVALAVWLWRVEPRRWVRALAWTGLGLVVFQGLLGGITVLLLLPKSVSISHALFAQLFFVVTALLVQATAPGWERLAAPAARGAPRLAAAGRWGLVTALALLVQLVIGATVRHNNAGLAIPDFPLAYGMLVPPLTSFPVTIHFLHRLGALAILVLVAVTLWRAAAEWRTHPAAAPLGAPALAMAALAVLQVLLGGIVIWSRKAVPATTAHLVIGALLLGVTAWLALRAYALAGAFPAGRGVRR